MHKQFTSYLLQFPTLLRQYLEQWASREDGWHTAAIATAAIATAVTIFLISGQPTPANFCFGISKGGAELYTSLL